MTGDGASDRQSENVLGTRSIQRFGTGRQSGARCSDIIHQQDDLAVYTRPPGLKSSPHILTTLRPSQPNLGLGFPHPGESMGSEADSHSQSKRTRDQINLIIPPLFQALAPQRDRDDGLELPVQV